MNTRFIAFPMLCLFSLGGMAVAAPQARIVGGQESSSDDWPFMAALMEKLALVRMGEQEFFAKTLTGAASGEVGGVLVDCGFGEVECEGVSGKICLIQRDGEIDFAVKIKNCQDGGGKGGIIYNNVPGIFSGTLQSYQASIAAVSVSREDGANLLAAVGSSVNIGYSTQTPDVMFCGGTLIDPAWVVTAAHCVQDKTADSIMVNIGGHDLETDQDNVLAVARIISHSEHNITTVRNDIALLELKSAVAGIVPVTLASVERLNQEILAGGNATALGRGLQVPLLANEAPPFLPAVKKLYEVELPLVASVTCNLAYNASEGSPNSVTTDMLCAGRAAGGVGTCFGDSGGPLLLRGADGNYQLAGITSWGIGCAQPELYDVYARVPFFAEQIDAVISGRSETLPGKTRSSGSGAWGAGFGVILWLLGVFRMYYRRAQ